MVKRSWVPRSAEIIQIDFNPIRGHEQANLRPAIVLSPQGYNDKTGLLVCVPCTRTIRHNPFEVSIRSLPQPGVALADQLRTLDWRDRGAYFLANASKAEMDEIKAKVAALLNLQFS